MLKAPVTSYSIDSKLSDRIAKSAIRNNDVSNILSKAQRSFMQSQVEWSRVQCFPIISARRWDVAGFTGLKAEEWDYDGYVAFELSVKAANREAAEIERAFVTFLRTKGLSPEKSAGLKTNLALERLRKHLK